MRLDVIYYHNGFLFSKLEIEFFNEDLIVVVGTTNRTTFEYHYRC